MQHKTAELTRFLEIKHRYWKLFTTQIPKTSMQIVRNLFRSDQRLYLFKNFDPNDENPNHILQHLKPIFFSQPLTQMPANQQQVQKHLQKLLTKMLQELSPMTPFHLKLYYYLTEKNTGIGATMGNTMINFYGQKQRQK
jgi:hypothetical protein